MNSKKGIDTFANEFSRTDTGKAKLLQLQKQVRMERVKNQKTIIKSGEFSKLAVFGDTHIGSKYYDASKFNAFYKYAIDLGYTSFLCTGDVVDGHNIYKGQIFEQKARGWDEQCDAFAETVPRFNGITTYFITGNHDDSFEKLTGAIIGEELERIRPDWKFLGQNLASIELESLGKKIRVSALHPGGGSAYALSYRPQKIVEQWEGGSKPDILCIGHFHKAELIPQYRNVAIIQSGTFQKQTPFMQSKGLSAHLGGWLLDMQHQGDKLLLKAEFISFF